MSQGYNETIILECSRPSSAEGIAHNNVNPAEFTNEVGSGLVLDIGDEISVHSAYVSELGAEAGEIEIKERNTLVPATSIVTTYEKFFRDETISTKYAYETSTNAELTIESKYEEMPIVVSPFKTSNGENYITLPRLFLGDLATNTFVADWNKYDEEGGTLAGDIGSGWGTLNPNQYVTADYKKSMEIGQSPAGQQTKGMIKNDNSRYTIFRMNEMFSNEVAAIAYGDNGSTSGLTPLILAAAGASAVQDAYDRRDVAIVGSWAQVKDLITLTAKKGFNSPSDVAKDLTLQLNKLGDKITKVFPTQAPIDLQLDRKGRIFTEYRETPSYKTYNCATPDKIAPGNYTAWKNTITETSTTADINYCYYYLSAYQHIGIKRPDFFTLGRQLNASQGFLIPPDLGGPGDAPQGGQCLNLAIPWSDENIEQFTAFFAEQYKHPEFWTDHSQQDIAGVEHDISGKRETTRFLHWNQQDDRTNPLNPGTPSLSDKSQHLPRDTLGYDLNGIVRASLPGGAAGGWIYNGSMCSFPVFFDFNPDRVHFKAADVTSTPWAGGGVANYDDLAYGWARKLETAPFGAAGTKYWIGIQFSQITEPAVSSVPLNLFWNDTHIAKNNGSGRRFGYDYHFTAYGNAAMMLYNGDLNASGQDFGDEGTLGTAYWMNTFGNNDFDPANQLQSTRKTEIFLGADSPAVTFDSVSSRFNIINLHTGERQGNSAAAGNIPAANASSASAVYYPVNPDANASCYKINKRNLANNYTPNMSPYHLGVNGSATLQYPAVTMFSNNYEPWTIYDAHGGLFIEDFVIPQFEWNSNLAGVMGYRYDQFHRDNGQGRQTRIDNYEDASEMDQPTTNALVNAGDFLGYTKNGFNNSNFDITTGYTLTPSNSRPALPPAGFDVINNYPAIDVLGISSTSIIAQELPTKSLRPYYTIRSDILQKTQFIGGNGDLRSGNYLRRNGNATGRPVIGIVDKVNGYADFYTQESSQLVFTNTQKRVITQIKTSIHDPDGSFADVDLNTSIIYKIDKQLNVDLNPLDTLIESKKKKDKQVVEQTEEMLKDPRDLKVSFGKLFK